MDKRRPVEHHRYGLIAVVWFASLVVVALLAYWLLPRPTGTDDLDAILAIVGVVVAALAIVSPFAVGLALWRLKDPAAGMTISALAMLGHVLLIAGPFVVATPFVARWMAVRRHASGGY